MSDEALKAKFHQEMLTIYDKCAEIGYRPIAFLTMVRKHKGVEAAKRLIASPETSGLAELALRGRLDLSMEKLMTKPEYQSLFTPEEIRTASNRTKASP
jgi:hypothetical protein